MRGLCHEPTQKKLLTESKLTLAKAIEIAQSMEAAEKSSQQIEEPQQEVVKVSQNVPRATEHHLNPGVVLDVVAQIMQQRTADTKKVNATSVEKKTSGKTSLHKERTREKRNTSD